MGYIRGSRRKKKDPVRRNGWKGFYEQEHPKSKAIVQMNLNRHYLNTWETMSIAAFRTKINITSISKCCHNKRHKAGGYKWCFVEDYETNESV